MPSIGRASYLILGFAALLASAPAFAQARPASPSEINLPISDARNAGPASVRFSATQFTHKAPTIAIFGVTKANWPTLRAAIQQAAFEGYAVEGIFIGPADAPPALEIYAKGQLVTNPINPNTIGQAELTKLIRDVWREYYS